MFAPPVAVSSRGLLVAGIVSDTTAVCPFRESEQRSCLQGELLAGTFSSHYCTENRLTKKIAAKELWKEQTWNINRIFFHRK